MAWSRLENVASVESTVPELFRTCTVSVSNLVVVVVSAVSTCSQKLRVAAVALEAMLTCCRIVSVVVVPNPSSHASKVPECGGSAVELLMISIGLCVEVKVHGLGLEGPFSNPGLPSTCAVVLPPEAVIVTDTVTL